MGVYLSPLCAVLHVPGHQENVLLVHLLWLELQEL